MDRRLLDHYNTELRHLREMAGEFARDYPKIAGRLALDPHGKEVCPDPHVERLLEGFAWLAARVHLQLDAEFPRFTQSLLEIVFPQFLTPIPSLTIVRFEPDCSDSALADGVAIPRGTRLRSARTQGSNTNCIFTTSQDVRLLPIRIDAAQYYTRNLSELELPNHLQAKSALKLRFTSVSGAPISALKLDPLEIFLKGSDHVPYLLYEMLIGHSTKVVIQSQKKGLRPVTHGVVDREGVRRKGFSTEEALLPVSARGFEGYRLLREYFALPQRFLFVELGGFASALQKCTSDTVDIVILFDAVEHRLENCFDHTSFDLFCTPAINLFSHKLDRLSISGRASEIFVCPDQNRPLDYEIFEFERVMGYGLEAGQAQEFRPFFHRHDQTGPNDAFYTVKRVPRMPTKEEEVYFKQNNKRPTAAGTDVYLTLVDNSNAPLENTVRQLGFQALCTNRHLPATLTVGSGSTDFNLETFLPVQATRCVMHPTDPLPSQAEGRFAWKLISHLSLNYMSLLDREDGGGPTAFREILGLYCAEGERTAIGRRQIEGLRDIKTKPLMRRVFTPGPVCFARGLEVDLLFDESCFEGAGVFLFGGVLENFLSRYVTINSFTETVVSSLQRGTLMRWAARPGLKGGI
ncbi:MAG: type VI secretion system baseplate subunit TssF [Verrucomicrobia bacterium]|nr:type VI secretion system baseplate subunit TssF [Verrucomicrobiota bacterium]